MLLLIRQCSSSWGVETPTSEIGLRTPVFDVPPNLNAALHTIMALTDAGKRRTLWIDQICILQKPPKNQDKIAQLKMMGEIYENASNVLIWLGNPPPHIPNAKVYVEQLPSIIEKIKRGVARIGPNFQPSVTAGLPLDDDPVWEIIVDVLHRDWYYRVWTLQEAVLAKELVVYYGANILDWDLVVNLYRAYGSAGLMPLRSVYDEKEIHYKSIMSIMTYRQYREKGKEIDWSHLLWTCGFRDCSNPLDRIFALLGMADKSVTSVIEPDYHADERQVFLDAFKVAIKYDHQLHILNLPFERGDTLTFERGNSKGLPTWCPNLKKRLNGCMQLSARLVGVRKFDEKSSEVFHNSKDHLTIKGLELDTIHQIAESDYPGFGERFTVERSELVSRFHEETSRMTKNSAYGKDKAEVLAAEALEAKPLEGKGLEAYCRTLIADVARAHNGREWSAEEMMTAHKYHFTPLHLHAHLSNSDKALSSKYGSLVNQACMGRKFILTTKGRVGLAPAKCQIGDVICVFLGACAAHVLRPNVDPPDTFRFVGDCYLHGIMNMEALDMHDKGDVKAKLFTVT